MCSSGHEIPTLGLDWGFIFKVTVKFLIPTSVLADAVRNHSTIRNGKISLSVKFLESGLQNYLACVSLFMPIEAVLHILIVWVLPVYLMEKFWD